jgi:hypothetical protein
MARSTFILGGVFHCLLFAHAATAQPQQSVGEVLQRAEIASRTLGTMHDFLARLEKTRDFRSLQIIYEADIQFADWAAGSTATILDSKKAVQFCRSFPVGSLNWAAAFRALHCHRRKDVMPYVQELMASATPTTRFHCYHLCKLACWDDLREYARADVEAKDFFPRLDLTLGEAAHDYLQECRSQRLFRLLQSVEEALYLGD